MTDDEIIETFVKQNDKRLTIRERIAAYRRKRNYDDPLFTFMTENRKELRQARFFVFMQWIRSRDALRTILTTIWLMACLYIIALSIFSIVDMIRK